jgi:hypothetical protein
MKLPYQFNAVVKSRLAQLLGIGVAAASLALGGCSAYEAGAPKSPVDYIEPHPAASEQQANDSDQGYEWFY